MKIKVAHRGFFRIKSPVFCKDFVFPFQFGELKKVMSLYFLLNKKYTEISHLSGSVLLIDVELKCKTALYPPPDRARYNVSKSRQVFSTLHLELTRVNTFESEVARF